MRFIDKMKRNRVVVEMRLFLRLSLHSFLDKRRRFKHRFNQGEIATVAGFLVSVSQCFQMCSSRMLHLEYFI